MIVLTYADLLAVAARVLRSPPAEVVDRTDLDAVAVTLQEVRRAADAGWVAAAAGALLHGLVRRRPFVRAHRRIAVAATVQMLALNELDLELEPAEIARLLDGIASGSLPAARLTELLSVMLRPLKTGQPTGEEAMFERFTDRARQVIVLAQVEARQLNHGYIGTEHVLLGLVAVHEGRAGQVLEELGVAVDAARTQVRALIGKGEQTPGGHIPFTPRAKRLLELSLREALQLGHDHLGTEHILLGLVREGKGVGAEVLVKLGVDLEGVRQRVIALAGEAPPEPAAEAGAGSSRRVRGVRRAVDSLIVKVTALAEENDQLRRRVEQLEAELHRHGSTPDPPEGTGDTDAA